MRTLEKKFTWKDLAEHTGYSTTTLRTLKDDHGAPNTPDPDLWDKWLGEHPEHGTAGNRVSKDREHWLTVQAEQRAALLIIERQKADGEIIYKSDLDTRDTRISLAQKAALYEILTTGLPVTSEGKSATEIRALNREAADRVCLVMQERLGDWSEAEDEK